MLRFGGYDLDIEGAGKRGRCAGARPTSPRPGYQELLYEAGRFQLAEGLSVEVASPEDLEHFSHVRRTGSAPEFRVARVPPRVGRRQGGCGPPARASGTRREAEAARWR